MKWILSLLSLLLLGACATLPDSGSAPTLSMSSSPCQEGAYRKGYTSKSTTADLACTMGVQVCKEGKWTGPELFDNCENLSKSCDSYPHGTIISGYAAASTPRGVSCTPATRTCTNGAWVGPEVFTSCTEGR